MLLRKIMSTAIATTIATSAMAFSLDDGRYYFRYRGMTETAALVPDDDSQSKDIVAFYIGGLGVPFSEQLPLKPQWEDDDWAVTAGRLPSGITFDPATRTFSGTPTELLVDRKIELTGFDRSGTAVASAKVTFSVYELPDARGDVDLYAHTNKFYAKTLDLPPGVVVERWKEVVQPPPGVDYNGRYVDGTPTKPGFYSILNIGYDYNGAAIFAYIGRMVVEDGPTFALVPDDVRKVSRHEGVGCGDGYECAFWNIEAAPTIRRAVNDAEKVDYRVEIENDGLLPSGLEIGRYYAPNKRLYETGMIFDFYDQSRIRLKATDVDGTVGYSNWFRIGTAGPEELCKPRNIATGIVLPGVAGRSFLGSGYRVPVGFQTEGAVFGIEKGSLPAGLSLDRYTGVISGVPAAEERQSDVFVRVEFPSKAEFEPISCGPYNFVVAPDEFSFKMSGAKPAYHVGQRVSVTFDASGALLEGFDAKLVSQLSNLPPEVQFVRKDADTWEMEGDLSTIGSSYNAVVELVNGDGAKRIRSFQFEVVGPITIGGVQAGGGHEDNVLHVRQFDSRDSSNPFYTFSAENVVGPAEATVEYMPESFGLSVDPQTLGMVGGTIMQPGTYGPFKLRVTDATGATAESPEFEVDVDPRAGLTGEIQGMLLQTNQAASWKPFVVTPEPLSPAIYGIEYSISPSTLPQGLDFDPKTGMITGTPTTVGTYPGYAVTATETGAPGGTSVTSSPFAIEVAAPAPIGRIMLPDLVGNANGAALSSQSPISTLEANASRIVGDVSAVRFLSSTPTVAGLRLDPADGMLKGTPVADFSGQVTIAIEDSEGRRGELVVPVLIHPYPALSSAKSVFELPRLSDAAASDIRVTANSGFYAGVRYGKAPYAAGWLPPGLTIGNDGIVIGRTTATAGTEFATVVRGTSTANGLYADLPITVRVVDQNPLVLDPAGATAVFKIDGATGRVTSTVPFVGSRHLQGSYFAPLSWSLGASAPSWLSFNQSSGLLIPQSNPPGLGEWTAPVGVMDAEGTVAMGPSAARGDGATGTPSVRIKVTLDGFVETSLPSYSATLRQSETFFTPSQTVSNVVGAYRFSSDGPSVGTVGFDAGTGAFAGVFDTKGQYAAQVTVKDSDGRGFSKAPGYRFSVLSPLAFANPTAPTSNAIQFSPDSPVHVDFGIPDNAIGSLTYDLDGQVPGTLYVKSLSGGLASYRRQSDGSVVRQAVGETITQTEAKLASDRMIFDPANGTLHGIASRAGTFVVTLNAHDSHQQEGYQASPSDPTRASYNNASIAATIVVAPKPAMALVASTGIPRHVIVNTQDSNMTVAATNVGYSVSSWTVSGASSLPPGVKWEQVGDKIRFHGVPTLLGTFSGITATATDARGETASLELSFKVIPSPDPITLNVSDIRTKVGMPFQMKAPYAARGLSTENTYGRLTFTSPDAASRGVVVDASTGELGGTARTVGDFVLNLAVSDDTDRLTSKAFNVSVLPNLRLIVPTEVHIEQGETLSLQTATDYAIGKVVYEKGAGAWPEGFSVNATTGRIEGGTYASPASYPGLTVIGRDEAGDVQASNAFSIVVDPIVAGPDIKNVTNMTFGTVAIPAAGFTPTVVDDVRGRPWNYGGTVYKANKNLAEWGLSIDPSTGKVSGTPAKVGTISGLVITVTSSTGLSDSTTPFSLTFLAPDATYSDLLVKVGTQSSVVSKLPANLEASTRFSTNKPLPSGMSIDPVTGVVSGAPTVIGVTSDIRVVLTGSWGTFSTAPFKITVTDRTMYKYWLVSFQGNMAGAMGYTGASNDVRLAEIALLDPDGSVMPTTKAYTYYRGLSTKRAWDGDPSTYLTDGLGSGIVLSFGDPDDPAPAAAAKVRITMTGTAQDLKFVGFCRSDQAGWGASGYHKNCDAVWPTQLPAPAGGGTLYAPGEVVELVIPSM